MSKTKSISDLVADLQTSNERLQFLEKLFEQACKKEFGYDIKTIHAMLAKQEAYEKNRAHKQYVQGNNTY